MGIEGLPVDTDNYNSEFPRERQEGTALRFLQVISAGFQLALRAKDGYASGHIRSAAQLLSQAETQYKTALSIVLTAENLRLHQQQEFRFQLGVLMNTLAFLYEQVHMADEFVKNTGDIMHHPEIFRKEMLVAGDLLLKALELESTLGSLHLESQTDDALVKWQEARRLVETAQQGYDEATRRYRQAVDESANQPEPSPSRQTILLLEDERMIARLLKNMLEQDGSTVLSASNGDDAIALCRQHQGEIRLLVSDVILRTGSLGADIAESLAKVVPDLPVLFISGYPEEQLVNRGLLDPANRRFRKAAFLMKPFSAATLRERVHQLIE